MAARPGERLRLLREWCRRVRTKTDGSPNPNTSESRARQLSSMIARCQFDFEDCEQFAGDCVFDIETAVGRILRHVDNPASASAYIRALSAFLRVQHPDPPLHKYLKEEAEKALHGYKHERALGGALTDAERAAWISWPEAQAVGRSARIDLRGIIVSLFTLMAPRRPQDWASMAVVRCYHPDRDDLYREYAAAYQANLIYVPPYGSSDDVLAVCYFGAYKTAGTYGVQRVECPAELTKRLTEWMRQRPSEQVERWLLPADPAGHKHLTAKQVGSYLTDVFEDETRKHVTCNILRHACVTHAASKDEHWWQLNNAAREALAREMGHSLETQGQYVREPPAAPVQLPDTSALLPAQETDAPATQLSQGL